MKKKLSVIVTFAILTIILIISYLYKDKIIFYYDVHIKKEIDISKYPFYAAGNGVDNDTWAIQQAIDILSDNNGGKVILKHNCKFLCTSVIMKNNITLYFEDDSSLIQSNKQDDYINYDDNKGLEYAPVYGHNITEYNSWDHSWYLNPPFIYAPEGTENIKIQGKGSIYMVEGNHCNNILHIVPIGFYKTNSFEISDISIKGYNSYACMLMCCENGVVKNIEVQDPHCENNDGITLMNCNNIRVTECKLHTGDDGIYIFSSYKDPRKSFWWNSNDILSTYNIEIDHNHCEVTDSNCKAFCMILWSNESGEISVHDINIHDNYFQTIGIWDESTNPFFFENNLIDIYNIDWKNNKIDFIQESFNRMKDIVDIY